MKFTIALSIALLTSIAAHADPNVAVKQVGIEKLKEYREMCSRFASVQHQDACRAAYDVLIARRKVEEATLLLWVISSQLSPMGRDVVFDRVAPMKELDQHVVATNAMFERVWAAFNFRSESEVK
jgi:hypothetical protein